MKKMTANEKKFAKELKRLRGIVETQIEHCDLQYKRFMELDDKANANDWANRKLACKKILNEFGPELVDLKEASL